MEFHTEKKQCRENGKEYENEDISSDGTSDFNARVALSFTVQEPRRGEK
jgi:hypothetical protein